MDINIFSESFVGLLQLLYDIFRALYDVAYNVITVLSQSAGDLIEFGLDKFNGIIGGVIPVDFLIPDFLYEVSLLTLMFGYGIILFLAYQLVTWILNLVT